MPGLVGFLLNEGQSAPSVQALAQRLEPETRFQRDLYEETHAGIGRVGLGRVSLRIINPEPQPVWNADRSVGLVMEGEFFEAEALRREVEGRGPALHGAGDAELALRLYELCGDDFAARLKGAFSIAVFDRRQAALLLTNDRLGLYPLYYTQSPAGLLFASGVRALFADPALPRAIDPAAIAQFLTFDHMLDDHTLLAAVKLLPQAATLRYSDSRLELHKYWLPQYASQYPLRKDTEWVADLQDLLRQSVKRQAGGSMTKGVLLSGGVDSRVILTYLAEMLPADRIETFCWGIPGCDDARSAQQVARMLGTQHHFYELKPDWLLHMADEAVRITDGQGDIVNLHALALAEEEGRQAPVVYKGFMGDAMMGYAIVRRFIAQYADDDLVEAHLDTYRDQGVITFDTDERPQLFTPEFNHRVGDAVRSGLRAGMLRSGVDHLSGQRLFFDMAQRVPRMTLNGVEVVRGHAVVRLPFGDYDLWDYTMGIPPGYLLDRYLYNRAFTEAFPRLAKIPIPATGLPMIPCAREIAGRGWKLAQWHLRNRGLSRLAGPDGRAYKDYTTWFRTVLREWVHEILLSQAALQRGYFKPDMVRRVVADHMAGANRTVQLGALLTLELWHRQFIDTPAGAQV